MADKQQQHTDDGGGIEGTTRRGALAALGGAGLLAALGGTAQADVGGGPASDEIAELLSRTYEGPESKLPSPGVEGRRYLVTDAGGTYPQWSLLRDQGDAWAQIDLSVGAIDVKSASVEETDTTELLTRRAVNRSLDSNRYLPTNRGGLYPFDAQMMNFENESAWSEFTDYTVDTSVFARGTQSFRFDLANGTQFAGNYGFSAVDISGYMPAIAVRRDSGAGYFELNVNFRDSTAAGANHTTTMLPGDSRPEDDWFYVDLGPDGIGPDYTDITDILIKVDPDPSATGQVWIDDLRLVPTRDRGAVVIIFDGSQDDIYDDFYPILDKYGASATIAIDDRLGETGQITENQLDELIQAGWELGVHTNAAKTDPNISSGAMEGISNEEADERLQAAKRYAQGLGYNDINYVVPLQNQSSTEYLNNAPKYYGLGYGSGHAGVNRSNSSPHGTSPWMLNRVKSVNTGGAIDAAEARNTVHTIYLHDTSEASLTEFENFVSYVSNRDLDILTPAQLLMERGSC